MPRVLVVKTGTTHPEVVRAHGDYDEWFVEALPGETVVVAPFAGEPLPDGEGFDGVLLTGSPASVRDEAPWMEALGRWTLDQVAAGRPVLGVCFGHQLLGEALGGRVDKNPNGREVGTIAVALTPEGRAHPLFEGLPDTLQVQSTHTDILVTPPSAPGVVRLAGNDNTAWQAFSWGPLLTCVQFHPEFKPAALNQLLALREQEGVAWPTAHGARILDNWWSMVARRSKA